MSFNTLQTTTKTKTKSTQNTPQTTTKPYKELAASFPTSFAAILKNFSPPIPAFLSREDESESEEKIERLKIRMFVKLPREKVNSIKSRKANSIVNANNPNKSITEYEDNNDDEEKEDDDEDGDDNDNLSVIDGYSNHFKKNDNEVDEEDDVFFLPADLSMRDMCETVMQPMLSSQYDVCVVCVGEETTMLAGNDQTCKDLGLIPRFIAWVFNSPRWKSYDVLASAALLDLHSELSVDLLSLMLFATSQLQNDVTANNLETKTTAAMNHTTTIHTTTNHTTTNHTKTNHITTNENAQEAGELFNNNKFHNINSFNHNNNTNNINPNNNNSYNHSEPLNNHITNINIPPNIMRHTTPTPQHAALYFDAVMAEIKKNGKDEDEERKDSKYDQDKLSVFSIHLQAKNSQNRAQNFCNFHFVFLAPNSANLKTGKRFQRTKKKVVSIMRSYNNGEEISKNALPLSICFVLPDTHFMKPCKTLRDFPYLTEKNSEKDLRTSDVDYSSSSEQSADTVIRVVKKDEKNNKKHMSAKDSLKRVGDLMDSFEKQFHGTCYESLFKHSLEDRKRPQGKEETIFNEDGKLQTLPDVLKSESLEQWVDGPIKNGIADQPEEVLNALPKELREHRGGHSLSSPRVKKIYSALKHKHKKQVDHDSKSLWRTSSNDCNNEKNDQVITASPDISAFHTFYTKYKQDLLQQNCNFSAATMHLAEIFMPEKCCCKCHIDKKEDSHKHCKNSPHKDKRSNKGKKHEKCKDEASEDKGVRTADWVTSVQETNFSKFSQLLHSRKQLIKSLQASNCTNDLKPLLVHYFQNASPIATFDTPVHNHHPSPPPEYYTCVEYSKKKTSSSTNTSSSNNLDSQFYSNGKIPYSVTTPDVLNEATSARKDGPDGASCHNLFLELQQLSHCIDQFSFHDSLQRQPKKKETPRKVLNDNLKQSRNYSSTETIYVPCNSSKNDSECGKTFSSETPTKNSPKKNHCSIAMALLSCATRYRGKQKDGENDALQRKNKLSSHFCLKQPLPDTPKEPIADDKHRAHLNRKYSKNVKSQRPIVSHSLDRGNLYVHSLNSPSKSSKHVRL